MSARGRRWVVPLGLVGIFAAGCVTGVLAAAGYVHHWMRGIHAQGPHAIHALGVRWLDSELDLDDEQEAAVERILTDAHLELVRFKSRHEQEVLAIVTPALERVDAQLDEEQARRWASIRATILEHASATELPAAGD